MSRPGDEPADPDDPLVGYRTEALLFEALLGHGAMGAVYRGRQRRLDRVVAIKVIAGHLTANAGYVERFTREARTLARLAHPHVVTCYDFGPIPGPAGRELQVLVMEYVDGESLGAKVVTTQSVRGVLELYRQVAEGLAAAHALGIVHRDIKPDNVMVTRAGQAKLADFGLAKPQASSGLTADGSVLGSPAYMAPEVCRGSEPSAASDLYSLGCALFQSLSGVTPFTAPTALEVIQQHITDPAPPLSRRVPTLAHLDALLARLLHKDPALRPSAAELAPLLAQAQQRVPASLRLTSGEIDVSGQAARAALATMAEPMVEANATTSTIGGPTASLAVTGATAAALAQAAPAPVAIPAAVPAAAAAAVPAPALAAVPDYLQPLPEGPTGPITMARPPAPPAAPAAPAPAAAVAVATAPAAPPPARSASARDPQAVQSVHAAAHQRRVDQAKSFQEQGDAHAAAGRIPDAEASYREALKHCVPGPASHALQAKIDALHHRRRRRRLTLGIVAGLLLAGGVIGVAVYATSGSADAAPAAPGDPAAPPRAAPSPAVTVLQESAQDPTRDPHPLLEQALGLAQAAPKDPVLAALVVQLKARTAAIDEELAVITRDRWQNPPHALIAAAHLRALAPGAGWLLRQLPLAGRVEATGLPSAQLQLTVDGKPQPPGMQDFCRTPGQETEVTVAAPGHEPAVLSVPPTLPETTLTVRLAESPQWFARMPLAQWARLQEAGHRLVIADSQGLRLVDLGSGATAGHLDAVLLGSHARGFLPPPPCHDLGHPLHLAADDGGHWTIPLAPIGFASPTPIAPGPVTASWCEQTFELHLGEGGAILALPASGDDETSRVEAIVGDHVQWTLSCAGRSLPGLVGLDRGAVVADAEQVRVLDQEGQVVAHAPLAGMRTAPPVWLAEPGILAVPTAAGLAAYQIASGTCTPVTVPVVAASLLAGDGHHRLIAATGTGVTLIDTTAPTRGWERPLSATVQGLWLGNATAVVTTAQDAFVLRSSDGELLRRLPLPTPALGPAIVARGLLCVACVDGVRAYPLAGAGAR